VLSAYDVPVDSQIAAMTAEARVATVLTIFTLLSGLFVMGRHYFALSHRGGVKGTDDPSTTAQMLM
jgi:hypothetical protein